MYIPLIDPTRMEVELHSQTHTDPVVESHSPRHPTNSVVELHSPRNLSSSSTATAKELRALPPSSPISSPIKRNHSPTLASHMKRNKDTGKGV